VAQHEPSPAGAQEQGQQHRPGGRYRAGTVSFLPVRPLIHGLDNSPEVDLVRAAPSRLKCMLAGGEVDVAFLPVIDLPCFGPRLIVLTAGCVATSGPTMLAKIFCQVQADAINVVWADSGSRSAATLVQVLWASLYHRRISFIPFDPATDHPPVDAEAVLLIGDRVVTDPPLGQDRQLDPAAMWHEMTGLPFVFGVWATTRQRYCEQLYHIFLNARQQGQQHLAEIAAAYAPAYGWPVDLAERCLTDDVELAFTSAHRESIDDFLEMATECKLIESPGDINYYPAP